ncbi:MAG: hypothetical protein Q7K23_00240 [Pseudomonas sp.]|nr:hypothetical protein [Pseudomonas sp.]
MSISLTAMQKTKTHNLYLLFILSFFLAVYLYRGIFDNPFIHDDYLWLEQGKRIAEGDFSGVFTLGGGRYFPTVIHLLYGICYKLFGLNFTLYHAISLFVHLINGILVYWSVRLLFDDYLWAFLSAFFFLANPVVSNAIIWPSAWVDIFAALCFLICLISYKLYLNKRLGYLYLIAFLGFLFSIFSKVIGIGLPLILLYLEVVVRSNSSIKQILKRLSPFFLTAICYLIPIYVGLAGSSTSRPQDAIYNIIRYIPALFVSEEYLSLKVWVGVIVAFSVTSILLYLKHKKEALFTVLLIAVALLPLTALSFSFKPTMLIDSINHRLYLPSIGSQMLIGMVIAYIYRFFSEKGFKKVALGFILAVCILFMSYSTVVVNQREAEWDSYSKQTLDLFQQIKNKHENIAPDSLVYFINIPSSSAFWKPMFRVYYGMESIEVERYPHIPDFRQHQYSKIYLYLYLYGRLFEDHKSIMQMANEIKTEDIGYAVKFYEFNEWKKGEIEFLKAVSVASDDAERHFMIAKYYWDMDMLNEAESEFRTSLSFSSSNSQLNIDAHYELGILYIAIKKYDKAMSEFEFVAKNESSPLAPTAEKLISDLKSGKEIEIKRSF